MPILAGQQAPPSLSTSSVKSQAWNLTGRFPEEDQVELPALVLLIGWPTLQGTDRGRVPRCGRVGALPCLPKY